jgi:hypothetical protein
VELLEIDAARGEIQRAHAELAGRLFPGKLQVPAALTFIRRSRH